MQEEADPRSPTVSDTFPIRLFLLGSLDLGGVAGGDGILKQPRRTAVLAYLGIKLGCGFQRRDTITALFWPEQNASQARAALRKAIHGLRDALGEQAILARGDDDVMLDPQIVWCDVTEFREAVRSNDHARALTLYRGSLLDGFYADAPSFERVVEDERRELGELAASSAWLLADAHDRNAHPTLAGRMARRAVRMAGADERVLRKALRLLHRQGDLAGALALHEEFASRLRDEFQATPSAETQALVRELRG